MPVAPPFNASLAVIVGIDEYGDGIPALRTAANDARRVAQTLEELHGYDVVQIIDAEATRERISRLLTGDLPARVGPNDRVLFYWAGHGVALDGDTGPNGYLLPSDARRGDPSTFLHMPFVHDALVALSCRHMLVVLDSCFSGAFRWSGTRAIRRDSAVIHREKYERFIRDPAWQVITSASQDELAFDHLSGGVLGSRDGDGAHSPFAMALFRALDGSADVIGGDGLVTANELFVYLDDTLQQATIEAGKRQTPGIWPLRKHGKGQFVFFTPNRELTLPPAPPLTYETNPWRGLSSYERSDAPLFFGRDASIASLTQFVRDHAFTVLLGASGTGKSSLVKAGVIPRLEEEPGWHILPVVRPGSLPLAALTDAVASLEPDGHAPAIADRIAAVVSAWCSSNPTARLVLVVDQTEELATMVRTPGDRDAFLEVLERLLAAPDDRVRVVLTLRTDFEPQFDRSALRTRWKAARFVIKPMSRADLQAVIEEPAARAVLYFDPPDLVDGLLDEVTNMPGALPLLSFALSEMYVRYLNRRDEDRALTREDYDHLGGVVGALRSRADEEYHALDEPHRATMKRMLLRMVGGGGGHLARRRVSSEELVYADAAENARVDDVRRRLVAARLLVEGKETGGDAYLEPAHDALVRGWDRLIRWIQQAGGEVVPLVTRQKLAQEAIEWRRAGDAATRDGLLWKDPVRSAMLTPLARERAPWLNEVELAFARDSVRGRQRARRVTRSVVLLVGLMGVVSFGLWRKSERDARVARGAEKKADSARVVAEGALADAKTQRRRAETEKTRAVRSLFSSLTLYMSTGAPGSICVRPACGAPRIADPDAWIVLGYIPDGVDGMTHPSGPPSVRNFIVAREYGNGHVLVYAHDGLTSDSAVRKAVRDNADYGVSDNLVFAENALRWLTPTTSPAECPESVRIVLWPGYVHPNENRDVVASIQRRGWSIGVSDRTNLAQELRCAGVLWFGNDWYPPTDFVTTHVPVIEQFVRRGGGLLVAGLGWSWVGNDSGVAYAGNQLGEPFGFRFTRDIFYTSSTSPLPLLSGSANSTR